MLKTILSPATMPYTQAALRVVAGSAFAVRGAQKLFGLFGGTEVSLTSMYGAAGVIEVVTGTLIIIGLFTRLAAFVASGEMAVAYFYVHVMGSGLFWWGNRGEAAMLFCFIFLFFAAAGAGPFSVDQAREKGAAPAGGA